MAIVPILTDARSTGGDHAHAWMRSRDHRGGLDQRAKAILAIPIQGDFCLIPGESQVSMKHVIVTFAAAMTLSLSSALCAQTATDEAAAAQESKRMKMDEATAADDKFHANRTEANMLARDQAEAEAAEAINKAHAAEDRARADRDSAVPAASPR